MSEYIKDRAKQVIDILDHEDGRVVREWLALREAEIRQQERAKREGPWWWVWAVGGLLLVVPTAAAVMGISNCAFDADLTAFRSCCQTEEQRADTCNEELDDARATIEKVSKLCAERP